MVRPLALEEDAPDKTELRSSASGEEACGENGDNGDVGERAERLALVGVSILLSPIGALSFCIEKQTIFNILAPNSTYYKPTPLQLWDHLYISKVYPPPVTADVRKITHGFTKRTAMVLLHWTSSP